MPRLICMYSGFAVMIVAFWGIIPWQLAMLSAWIVFFVDGLADVGVVNSERWAK